MAKSIHEKIKANKKPRVYIEHDAEINEDIIKYLTKVQLLYSAFGLIAGVIIMVLGCALLYLGISGQSNFVANAMGIKAELSDAAPGTILIVVGLIVIALTKFKFTLKKTRKDGNKEN